MAVFREHAAHGHGGEHGPFRSAVAWFALGLILCLPGCGGCRKTPEAAEQEKKQAEVNAKKKEKEQDPFEARQPAVMPTGARLAGWYKPGHWISHVWPGVKSNRDDFQGTLQTDIANVNGEKVHVGAAPYELTAQRPVALARQQPKSLESIAWIPPGAGGRSVNLHLSSGGGGLSGYLPLSAMPSYRYYFVVLSHPAGRYAYLDNRLSPIQLVPLQADAGDEQEDRQGTRCYEVVSMSGAGRPTLPANALCWTSIAYLLWDDFDPALWDVEQQRALIDWLHWGGQIIVSGPDALEQLRNSFLRPFLPAAIDKSRSLLAKDLAELSYWAGEFGQPPMPVKPWPGADLKKDPRAEYLPYTGDLLVERQVGRGRIVASAFRLSGPELTGWNGFPCFFNACLLRRPARIFSAGRILDTQVRWADGMENSPERDAAKMTAVRFFARDTGVPFATYAADMQADPTERNNPAASTEKEAGPGLGAWNDFSPVAQAAQSGLNNAAGIHVPERSFIIWVVLGYLCVLVPANWLVCRLMGRVEWAWIAAPLIAIACTIVVIHMAQLNIGFARSRNEIAVIEMQPGYSRAHVARYTVLYTSLATRYEFRLDDPGGQILPFPCDAPRGQAGQRMFGAPSELICRRGEFTQLGGFRVDSNAVGLMHSEEMADCGGAVGLHRDSDGVLRVTNATRYSLDHCQAIRGPAGAELAKIDRLEPGATAAVKFMPRSRPRPSAANNPVEAREPTGDLSADGIAKVALERLELRPGEICLVARVVDHVPGLTVTPEASQTRQAALLVAHLDPGQLPPPAADAKKSDSQ